MTRVLELFAGTAHISKAFAKAGYEVVSVDLDNKFKDCIHADAYTYLEEHGREYDIIWASPDCRTYSKATHCHRNDRTHAPISDYAVFCDEHNRAMISWLKDSSAIWFIENPTGHLRHMDFMAGIPRYTTTFCRYGHRYRKSTDIWTNLKGFSLLPACSLGAHCHSNEKNGNSNIHGADRAAIPNRLCDAIVKNVRNADKCVLDFYMGGCQ